MKRFIILALFLILLFPSKIAWGVSLDECSQKSGQEKIDCLQKLLNETSKKEETLNNEIIKFNVSISLTETRISWTENQVVQLEKEIKDLSGKISKLEDSLGHLSSILLERVSQTYRKGNVEPFSLLLSANGFGDFMTRLKYLKIAQAHDKKLMFAVQDTKDTFADQKQAREEKKKELSNLKIVLAQQKIDLENQQQAKRNLLAATKNDEMTYQKLLEKARVDLAGFSAFTQAAGGGLASFGIGSNGWYFSQRDPQWGNLFLGNSPYTVWKSGCAVASVAMVCKSYGQDITPATIANDPNNFTNTSLRERNGDLIDPKFNCSGKTNYWWWNPTQDQVKSYINNNTSVILRLVVPSVSGLHFVVAFGWSNDKQDFIIHDPYYGPDKDFSEKYTWSQVSSAVVIH